MPRPITLADAIRHHWGCPICWFVEKRLNDFIASSLQRWMTDERERFVATQGLCPAHADLLLRWASPMGIAVLYPPLLQLAADFVALWSTLGRMPNTKPSPMKPRCPVCAERAATEETALTELLDWLHTEEGRQIYAESRGVCLPHFRRLWTKATGELRSWLLQTQQDQLRRLSDDLQSYRQKRETLRRHAITPAEETAWATAVEKLSGRWQALAPTESEVSCDG
ncbi:MAG: DUF6062 family protein [Armatimonadota bacterium]|nr:DUF6062 family protein [Armatimonadota bacterium]